MANLLSEESIGYNVGTTEVGWGGARIHGEGKFESVGTSRRPLTCTTML